MKNSEKTNKRIIDEIMLDRIKIAGISMKVVDVAFVACIFVLAFLIRVKLFPIQSADYYGFLEKWMQSIRDGGGLPALAGDFYNYTPPYMYLMVLISKITNNDLYGLKMISVIFDYLGAIAVLKILYHMTGNVRKSIIGMSIMLLSPTVILDSAYWCQCDMIYTTFLLYSFYYFLKEKSFKSALFFAFSFAFKLQSVFLLPFFIIMWLKKKTILLRHYLIVPVVYVIAIIPAFLAGRGFKDLLTIYFSQSSYYPWGTLNYPNVYALLGEVMPDTKHAAEVCGAGTFMTIAMMGCLAYYLYDKKLRLTEELMVTLALFSVAIIVYSLPHMHDRYGFLIDLFAIIYGVYRVKKLPVACGFMLVSIITFMPYLIGTHIVPLQYMAIALLGLIVYVGYDLYRQIQENILLRQD